MAAYRPSAEEQAAIDLLTLAGFTVLRQRSYAALQERVRVAEALQAAEHEYREGSQRWARQALDEQNRLARRLNAVCTGAAALGVSITDINAALAAADNKDS
jgi:hypothetical protein